MTKTRLLTGLFVGCWLIYFFGFWSRALYFDSDQNLVAGHVNIWGDWAAHLTMGTHLAVNNFQLLDSPFLIGATFAYPFAANALSALLWQLGIPLQSAFTIPSFVFSVLTVIALLIFYRVIFRSPKIAILAATIFLLNGGLGFMYLIQDMQASPALLSVLLNPPHEYTRIDDEQIKWISVIDSMIIPQRAFTHGFPLTLLALALILAGVILGLMPIIHTHSFLAAVIILASWGGGEVVRTYFKAKSLQKMLPTLRPWLLVAGISAVLAIPLYLIFFAHQTHNFITFYPGWLAREYQVNWLLFWFKNWGIVPLLALLGWWNYFREKTTTKTQQLQAHIQALATFAPFFLLFILLNLFLFQPFAWDNTKLLVWASVGFSGLTAFALATAWKKARQRHSLAFALTKRLVIFGIFIITIASGAIDAYRIQRIDLHNYVMHTQEELALAEWVMTHTPADSVWLTGDKHNHWLFNLTGRQSLLTYRGWLWTHGYDYKPVERDVGQLFRHPNSAALYQKYNISYVVIGPNETEVWKAQPAQFRDTLTLIHQTPHYRLFAVPDYLRQ
jgi:hypothetical protein